MKTATALYSVLPRTWWQPSALVTLLGHYHLISWVPDSDTWLQCCACPGLCKHNDGLWMSTLSTQLVTVVTNLHCSRYLTLCQLPVWWPATCNGLPGVYWCPSGCCRYHTPLLRKDTGVQILRNSGIPNYPFSATREVIRNITAVLKFRHGSGGYWAWDIQSRRWNLNVNVKWITLM